MVYHPRRGTSWKSVLGFSAVFRTGCARHKKPARETGLVSMQWWPSALTDVDAYSFLTVNICRQMLCEEASVFSVSMMSVVRVFVERKITQTQLTSTNRTAKFAFCLFEFILDFMTLCLSSMEVEEFRARSSESPSSFLLSSSVQLIIQAVPRLAIYSQGLCGEHPCPVSQWWYGLLCWTENDTWWFPWPLSSMGRNVCECVTLEREFKVSSHCCLAHSVIPPTNAGVLDSLLLTMCCGTVNRKLAAALESFIHML